MTNFTIPAKDTFRNIRTDIEALVTRLTDDTSPLALHAITILNTLAQTGTTP